MELFTGLGLATASGLNAYIPLLAMGLLGRFTNLVELPHPWAWLTNGWVIGIVTVLLVVEIVADKVPALDSINDTIQIKEMFGRVTQLNLRTTVILTFDLDDLLTFQLNAAEAAFLPLEDREELADRIASGFEAID